MISFDSKFGSIDEILMRSSPFRLSSAITKSRKFSSVDLPKSPMLTPVRIISFAPLSMAFLASINVLSIEAFLLRPRAKGMVQNEQK